MSLIKLLQKTVSVLYTLILLKLILIQEPVTKYAKYIINVFTFIIYTHTPVWVYT